MGELRLKPRRRLLAIAHQATETARRKQGVRLRRKALELRKELAF